MSELGIALVSGLIGMIGFGLADFIAAMSVEDYSESEIGLIFYALTALMIWTWFFLSGNSIPILTLKLIVLLVTFAFVNFAGYKLFFKSLRLGNLGVMSALFSSYAVLSMPVSHFVFAESMPIARWLILLAMFAGISRVTIEDFADIKLESGAIYALLAALVFSVMFPFWDATLETGNWIFMVAFVDTVLALVFLGDILITPMSITRLAKRNSILLMSVGGIANALAVVALSYGLSQANHTSIVIVLSSAVAVVSGSLGHVFLGENHKLSKVRWFGIAWIVIFMASLGLT